MCIFTNSLMFLNIMQNQGVILYIFPHIYPFAQPIAKTEAYASVFLYLRYFAKLKKLRGIFYFDSAPELQIRLVNYIRNFS